ncbi:hypothetical protein QQF64_026811 [Cirrhinus molitorella]|uniref:Uncharacterized protein n=1 Tax=Cirrhinus molitorella TaxID=172907 RepID=A0ABR3NAW9_9TELE
MFIFQRTHLTLYVISCRHTLKGVKGRDRTGFARVGGGERAHPLRVLAIQPARPVPLSLTVPKRLERRPENVIGGELRRPCLSEASFSCGNKGGSLGYRFSRIVHIPLE